MLTDNNNDSRPAGLVRVREGGLSSVLRAVCGAPAGWRERRRGSFLVLVVGTLALMALLTVVYVSVGSSDRRTSSALAKLDKAEEVPQQYADYIASIISDDVFDVVQEPMDTVPGVPSKTRRESWDYPSIDWLTNSIQARRDSDSQQDKTKGRYFTPVGGHGDDPWLASTEPTWLAHDASDAMLSSVDPKNLYLYYRDWGSISNPSPDGRFVNLKNLRGNITSASGFAMVPPGPPGKTAISQGLMLLPEPNNPARPTQLEKYPRSRQAATDFGLSPTTLANEKLPAVWSERQVGAFRLVYRGTDSAIKPNDDWYPDNQWADADGDGYYDSRWHELVDARDIDGDGKPDARGVLAADGRYRYFFATRIIDLSGLVNVNTATDFRVAPTERSPAGLYPSDIDLRRLLSMRDFYDLYSSTGAPPGQTVGYNKLKQPALASAQDPANYENYTRDNALLMASAAPGSAPSGAYDSLRMTLHTGVVPGGDASLAKFATVYKVPDGAWRFDDLTAGVGADRRAEYYRVRSGQPDGVAIGELLGQAQVSVAGAFNMTDQLELLTYWGVNNPAMLSRLEQTLGGRGRNLASPANGRRMSPFRENRGLDLERQVDNPLDPVQDAESMLRSAIDIRRLTTTVSGGRPITSTVLTPAAIGQSIPVDQLSASEVRIDLAAKFAGGNVADLTKTIATSIMRVELDQREASKAWGDPTGADFKQRQTEYYGGKGPQLPLRIAAHMAVNLIDSYDTNNTPSAYTLLIDRGAEQTVTSDAANFPWWKEGKQINLKDAGVLRGTIVPAGSSATPMPPAVNIFGVEAQPFLTEVATFTVYTDSPISRSGHPEPEPPEEFDEFGDPIPPPITIDGAIADGNEDFLFRVIAFQIHNPFDQVIKLTPADVASGDMISQTSESPYYYIQYGGKTMALAKIDDQMTSTVPPSYSGASPVGELTISPGETLVCYATSQSLHKIAQRIAKQKPSAGPPSASDVDLWIKGQLSGPGITNAKLIRIPVIDTATGRVSTSFQSLEFSGSTIQLKRTMRTEGVDLGAVPNSLINDFPVDRITVPDATQLNRTRASGEIKLRGTTTESDDTGYTITLSGVIRRPTDSGKRGGLPSACIQPYGFTNWNKHDEKFPRIGALGVSDNFDSGAFSDTQPTLGARTIARWLTRTHANPLCDSIRTEPAQKLGWKASQALAGLDYDKVMPEVTLNNKEFKADPPAGSPTGTPKVSTLRAADVLMTWGIGAYETPISPTGTPLPPNDPTRWRTLGESMAMCLGIYDPASPPTAGTFEGSLAGALDRGSLKLDAYAPFFDTDGDGVFNPAAGDVRRGLGVPIALNLLEAVRGIPQTSFPDQFGGISRLTAGVININTAPVAGLRLIPMLSPTTEPNGWWWTAPSALNTNSDIAATLAAYRDKSVVFTRPNSTGAVTRIDFRDRPSGDPTQARPDKPKELNGRSGADTGGLLSYRGTGIKAIREEPGFRSVGEIMAARSVDPTQPTSYTNNPNNIDFLGRNVDGAMLPIDDSRIGVDSFTHVSPTGTRIINDIGNEYGEQLAIAGGVLNTISVRSDIFAVWFIVRGYQQADVEGLKPEDPMTPSIERRYVMVVDRSNVVRRGDKPKILLFKEVPL